MDEFLCGAVSHFMIDCYFEKLGLGGEETTDRKDTGSCAEDGLR